MGVCIGADVSKEHLDWVAGEQGDVSRALNTRAGVRRLVAKRGRHSFAGCDTIQTVPLDERGLRAGALSAAKQNIFEPSSRLFLHPRYHMPIADLPP